MEPHWNPMAEAQAVDRVHRIGQTREVKVTRYCVQSSIEEVSFSISLSTSKWMSLVAAASLLIFRLCCISRN
jgi:hypothetical protein